MPIKQEIKLETNPLIYKLIKTQKEFIKFRMRCKKLMRNLMSLKLTRLTKPNLCRKNSQ